MNSFFTKPLKLYRPTLVLLFGALFVVGCSGSSDSQSVAETSAPDTSVIDMSSGDIVDSTDDDATNTIEETDATPEVPETVISNPAPPGSVTPTSTRVEFNITVPAYQSNALQVRLQWGDRDISAAFVVDESWSVVDDFPTDTENELVVTFNDNNGAITLGSFEQTFRTGSNESESFQIAADQFDTDRWDDDSDGISNLDELISGSDPLVAESAEAPVASSELPQAVQANLELVQDKTFRITWQPSAGAEFYRVLENPDGVSGFSQVSNDLGSAVQTFDQRVALYKMFNASYVVQSCNGSGCTDSDELIVSGTLEEAIGYFKASNTEFEDFFGSSVSLSADGNTMAVAASSRFSVNSPIGGESDAVYVFQRFNGSWVLQEVLRSNADDGFAARFGSDISLAADGNTLAVGENFENNVYVFVRTGGAWELQALLEASNSDLIDGFGGAVSLDADGNSLVIGASREQSAATGVNGDQSDNSLSEAGAVYVFERNNGDWQQRAYLKASNTDIGDNFGDSFGRAVGISPDGNTLAVGATGEDSAVTGVNGDDGDNSAVNAGAVYVFVRSNETWQQQAYLKASNTRRSNGFGNAVSFSFDGDTLVVGSSFFDNNRDDQLFESQGAVYTFTRTNALWQQQAFLQASNADPRGLFGASISLSADGNTLAVGAPDEGSFATGINGSQETVLGFIPGAVYTFTRDEAVWQQQAYVKASNTDGGDRFGSAVSLSLDGNTLAVGAIREESTATGVNGDQSDNSSISRRTPGAVYLY